MTLKKCKCGKVNTTKNAKFLARRPLARDLLWFNCLSCNTTFVIGAKSVPNKKAA